MSYAAQLRWVDGMQFVGQSGSGHGIVLDTPESKGGGGTGPSPMELLLIGLAGCTAMDVVYVLKRKRKTVFDVQVKVEAERAEDHPRVYSAIKLHYIVEGRDLSEKVVTDAIELSQNKYCSASAMLGAVAKISYDYQIIQNTGEQE